MAPSQLTLFLTLNLVLLAAVHGCEPYCSNPPAAPTPPVVVPTPPVVPTPSTDGSCPMDTLKLSVCANVLNLIKLNLNVLKTEQCCPLLSGLADLDAALCLCTAVKANILGINLNLPVDLTLLLNHCGKTCPPDFTCPL